MTSTEQHIKRDAASTNRLVFEGLTDGVFAIVMTLLVLGLGVPVLKASSMHQEFTQLLEMWPKFTCYFVTFLMLGFLWFLYHFMFSFVKRADSVLVWANTICLMFTALLPFSTSLLAENMGRQLPILIYEGNYFMVSLIAYLGWLYASGKYRLLYTNIDLREVKRRTIIFLISMAFTAILMGISYLNPIVSISMFVVQLISMMILSTLRLRIRAAE